MIEKKKGGAFASFFTLYTVVFSTVHYEIAYVNAEGIPIMLHKPHPSGIMKKYQLKQIKDVLEL